MDPNALSSIDPSKNDAAPISRTCRIPLLAPQYSRAKPEPCQDSPRRTHCNAIVGLNITHQS
eukprot:3902269-Rhodomonas_salina.3